MKHVITLVVALLVLSTLAADSVAWARGGRGTGGRAGAGASSGRSRADAQRRRDRRTDKVTRRILEDRALAENHDAIRRDALVDTR